MRRYFNTEGLCKPNEHYMVKLDDRLARIRKLYVERGRYFVINRGRQYGKTTTLRALAEYLKNDYIVISLDFQEISAEEYVDAQTFVCAFAKKFVAAAGRNSGIDEKFLYPLQKSTEYFTNKSLRELFEELSQICANAEKPIVLMIDEVDSASNNQVFIDFLAQLRGYYLNRENQPIFQSVILAGVYDVKNLKLKIQSNAEHQYNSPWNIAADFTIDMNFSSEQIAVMLGEYEADQHTGMDVETVSEIIFAYTSGYPYLVSAICKLLDEEIGMLRDFKQPFDVWTENGITEAVKILLGKQLPLFQSMIRQLNEYPELKQMLSALLFQGKRISFNIDNPVIELAAMFGILSIGKAACRWQTVFLKRAYIVIFFRKRNLPMRFMMWRKAIRLCIFKMDGLIWSWFWKNLCNISRMFMEITMKNFWKLMAASYSCCI